MLISRSVNVERDLEQRIADGRPRWNVEGYSFRVALPDASGQCAAGSVPVYRAYNNGAARDRQQPSIHDEPDGVPADAQRPLEGGRHRYMRTGAMPGSIVIGLAQRQHRASRLQRHGLRDTFEGNVTEGTGARRGPAAAFCEPPSLTPTLVDAGEERIASCAVPSFGDGSSLLYEAHSAY